MNLVIELPKLLIIAVIIGGLGLVVFRIFNASVYGTTVKVEVPQLSEVALRGERLFETNCVRCHGANASGSSHGPPLVHDIYNPGHHSDQAFFSAVKNGVRQHHWPYGNMPAQPQVTEDQIAAIVKYVRELQAANAITYRPHKM